MSAIEGFVYVPDSDPGVFAGAGPGMVVRTPSKSPPWIVVHHALQSTLVTYWPGRLLRVTVVDADGVEQAAPHFTRAVAVKVIDEIPAWRLFGEHGEAVAAILSFASRLDAPTAERLAGRRHPDADQASSRAFQRWLDSAGSVAGPGHHSPVGGGFSCIHWAVWQRAETVAGREAFVEVEDDDAEEPGPELELGPPWEGAFSALYDAAMALGAPSCAAEDTDILLTAWRAVTGAGDPPPIERGTDGR